jgi:hypothetical protein
MASKESTLDRVRKLLAKAEAEGVTPPEAEALTAYPRTRRAKVTYSGRGYGAGHAQGQRANLHNQRSTAGSSRAGIAR